MNLNLMMQNIHNVVCQVQDVDYKSTFGKTRKREIVTARQITYAITRKMCRKTSLADIGFYFRQDHATVLHAVKTINNLCYTDSKFRSEFNYIYNRCKKLKRKFKIPERLDIDEFIKELKKTILSSDSADINTIVSINELLSKL